MRTIERSTLFKKDYKRECKSKYGKVIDTLIIPIFQSLAIDEPLEAKHRDHELSGNWVDHRECHIKPDLLLIYQKPDEDTLRLVRLGSHSNLFR